MAETLIGSVRACGLGFVVVADLHRAAAFELDRHLGEIVRADAGREVDRWLRRPASAAHVLGDKSANASSKSVIRRVTAAIGGTLLRRAGGRGFGAREGAATAGDPISGKIDRWATDCPAQTAVEMSEKGGLVNRVNLVICGDLLA